MDELLAEILASSLMSIGLFRPGIHRIAELSLDKQPAPFYERWLSSSIRYLQQRQLLGQDLMVSRKVRDLADLWLEWEEKKFVWAIKTDLHAQIVLLEACLKGLPGILSGKQLATDVIFPRSSMHLVEGIYRGHAVADYFNEVLGDTLSAWGEHKLQSDKEHKFRILEIGAGTGATTAKLLPLLQRFPVDEYCYTDVSRVFLMHADEQYHPRLAALVTKIFDVSKPLTSQAIAANRYDVVVATNVLHATPNIRETLRNVKAALKNQGIILLNEISTWSLFTHLTFGLLEGWWLHEDTALRLPGSPGLAPEKWQEVLAEEGFESIFFPAEEAHKFGQQIIVATSDGWVRQQLNKQAVTVPEHKAYASAITMPAPMMEKSAGPEDSLREKSIFRAGRFLHHRCWHCDSRRISFMLWDRYRVLVELLPHPSIAGINDNLLSKLMRFLGREKNRFKALFGKNFLPFLRGQSRTSGQTQRGVLMQPPSFQQAKGQVGKQGPSADFIKQNNSLVLQCGFDIAQRFPDIRRSM